MSAAPQDAENASLVLSLPFSTPSQNELNRWHWSRRTKLRNECQLIMRGQARRQGYGQLAPASRTRMILTRFGKRSLDYDNLVAGCKPVVDALKREGLIEDDSPRCLISEYLQERTAAGFPHGMTLIQLFHLEP